MIRSTCTFRLGSDRIEWEMVFPDNNPNTGLPWSKTELKTAWQACLIGTSCTIQKITSTIWEPDPPYSLWNVVAMVRFNGGEISRVLIPLRSSGIGISEEQVFQALSGKICSPSGSPLEQVLYLQSSPYL